MILPKVNSLIIKQQRQVPQYYKLESVTVRLTSSGRYYASILFEYEQEIQQKELKNFIGLDFSMHELYVTSDNTKACYPRFYRQAQEKLTREQRKLSKMQKGSNNRNKQSVIVAWLYKKKYQTKEKIFHINYQGR